MHLSAAFRDDESSGRLRRGGRGLRTPIKRMGTLLRTDEPRAKIALLQQGADRASGVPQHPSSKSERERSAERRATYSSRVYSRIH